jgi:hypothetical protein
MRKELRVTQKNPDILAGASGRLTAEGLFSRFLLSDKCFEREKSAIRKTLLVRELGWLEKKKSKSRNFFH